MKHLQESLDKINFTLRHNTEMYSQSLETLQNCYRTYRDKLYLKELIKSTDVTLQCIL